MDWSVTYTVLYSLLGFLSFHAAAAAGAAAETRHIPGGGRI